MGFGVRVGFAVRGSGLRLGVRVRVVWGLGLDGLARAGAVAVLVVHRRAQPHEGDDLVRVRFRVRVGAGRWMHGGVD